MRFERVNINHLILVIIIASLFSTPSHPEEGTTTIPPSELTIIGEDRSLFEWRESLPEVSISFEPVEEIGQREIERRVQDIELEVEEKKTPILLKETPSFFTPSETIPSIALFYGINNTFLWKLLYAKERDGKSICISVLRNRSDGFDWKGREGFWRESRDEIEAVFGVPVDKRRLVNSVFWSEREVFFPYRRSEEERREFCLKSEYKLPFCNMDIKAQIREDRKGRYKNRGLKTEIGFDIGRIRFSIEGEAERDAVRRDFSSLQIIPPSFRVSKSLFDLKIGVDYHKSSSKKSFLHIEIEAKPLSPSTFTTHFELKTHLFSPSFSELFLSDRYTLLSDQVKPETIFRLTGGCFYRGERLSVESSLFIERIKDYICYYKKEDGLYQPRNIDETVTILGGEAEVCFEIKEIPVSVKVIGCEFSENITYLPKIEMMVSAEYKRKNLSLMPVWRFCGVQKIEDGSIGSYDIVNILVEREVSRAVSGFIKIENLFSQRYLVREDYPGKEFEIMVGAKISL